jgi:putative ABC transport system ATP-binding protein
VDAVVMLTHVSAVDGAGLPLLFDVRLVVQRGESVAILGPSGSGKSLLLRMIAGMALPRGGSVQVEGRDVGKLSYAEARLHRTAVGYVFDAVGLLANQSLGDNVALPLEYHRGGELSRGEVGSAVSAIATELDFAGWLGEIASGAPAAVRKRALLARALILEPRLLLVDDPHGSLTRAEAEAAAAAIERRRRTKQMTVLMTSTNFAPAPFVADRCLYLEQGRLVTEREEPPPSTPMDGRPRG